MESDEDNYDSQRSQRSDSEAFEPTLTESEQLKSKEHFDRQVQIKNKVPDGIRLFLELSDKTEEARENYSELDQCTYQNKSLGSSGQEPMTCVCEEDWYDGVNHACDDDDCINRGTKVECISGEGSCGVGCVNQRLQRKQYAQVTVIQTEMKGYGLRADSMLEPDTLVYEYIGEVIDEKTFKTRMIEYDRLKLRHFYFMMLQKGEFIDATRKGSLGRFCNHSCNPNCYVEKWVVGDKLKMGIFAKRRILQGEELTFNYNVDRYGANAQPCHCGERNCIGFIGGKTQTDAASLLPQLISQALGSSVEDEQEFLKLMKEKGQKLVKTTDINVDFVKGLVMQGIVATEVHQVMGALLQVEDKTVCDKLIERLELSSDAIHSKAKYSHGFQAFGRIFKFTYDKSDKNWFQVQESMILRLLSIMKKWVVSKDYLNKVHITPIIEKLIETTDSKEVKKRCEELLKEWSTFKNHVKISKSNTKRKKFYLDDRRRERAQETSRSGSPEKDQQQQQFTIQKTWRKRYWKQGWYATSDPNGAVYYYNADTKETAWNEPLENNGKPKRNGFDRGREVAAKRQKAQEERSKYLEKVKEQDELNQIIEDAKKLEEDKQKKLEHEQRLLEEKARKREEYRLKKSKQSQVYDETEFKKRWSHYFAKEVPNMLKKYVDEIGKDNVRECGRDITHILVDKEYKKDVSRKPAEKMDVEKRKKVKMFTESYMEKFLEKYRSKHHKRTLDDDDGSRKKPHT
ncbi:SET domain-containing protein [Cyberlindnera jadinii NRRL Y-1542]|uniref:Histone-lysine N-methyltransferase, H3 lysine-36 specific n=1 Tax=Cyberlindnera jadinii (strain ATCC 18201 / CBS 1600 / BCRC 20928 / JCM 3617 / NBRC 0987 / NRRL Y-1542) TaxID=983966 RepID=A0A1E4RWT9_CYBJN|nr:SET domain-containing protein [Cyberlindnera jadinii NRRL Y-1542]ODV71747.1 SET domain-containing protein [Cyberlindnera jadinii NRRL Y-1542]